MHKYFTVIFVLGTFLFTDPAFAQMDDEPPPPPPLGDVDEPPPPPPRRTKTRKARKTRGKKVKAVAEDDAPVVRATGDEGNMGLFFRVGGLGELAATGDSQGENKGVFNSQIGLKFVMSESFMLPIFFGMGVVMTKANPDADSETGFSMDFGVGFEYHFRIWRRLSPFFGATMKLGFYDPKSNDADEKVEDLSIRFHMGPVLGVEYYIADRVSIAVAYMLMITLYADTVNKEDGTKTTFDFSTKSGLDVAAAADSGGQLTVTFYF